MSTPPTLLEILRQQVEQRPDRAAFSLVDDDRAVVLTFAGLDERVRTLGSAIAERTEPGDRVAVCMENRPAWPVAYLAVWFAGGVTIPVDPALESDAIARVFEHGEAKLCLTSAQLKPKVARAAAGLDDPPLLLDVDGRGHRRWDGEPIDGGVEPAEVLEGGTPWDDFVSGVSPLPEPRARPDGPATLMYTSGTTGLPKAVMLTERAIAANVAAGLERIELSHDDTVLGVLPLFHALPMMTNFLAPMWVGGRVVYLSELDPDRIIAAFPRHGISMFACVPLFFYRFHDRVMQRLSALPALQRRLVGALLRVNRFARRRLGVNLGARFFGRVHEPFGPRLRILLTGGAKFDAEVYSDFLDLGFPLIQGYGLTEAAAGLTLHPLDEIDPTTVGKPLDGIELRVREPTEEGVGEIQARTPSRMLGYYRNPEATEEIFDGDWLRTGDLGSLDDAGQLRITGRAKDVIVLASGKNIYPDELEAYYEKADIVDEICVLGIDDPSRRGAERLHGVVVPNLEVARARGETNVREMVKWEIDGLAAQLPSPQRLTSIEIRTEPLPRTTTRKLKRFALRREVLEGREERASAAVESVPVEEDAGEGPAWAGDVRSIVRRHADVAVVRDGDHLDLDLGLESLDRVELKAELEAAFGVDIPDNEAGEVQTVSDLVELVGARLDEDARAERSSGDRWVRVLDKSPDGMEPYLRNRPVSDLLARALLTVARAVQHVWGLRVTGRENLPEEFPFMVAPNHLSYADPFLLGMGLPWRVLRKTFFVGYSAYFSGPITSRLARVLRTVPIDQSHNLERAMQAAAEGLRRGMVLGIFPEGSRSTDGSLQPFRRGTAILARVRAVPVVPVGIWGTYEMWPRKRSPRPHPLAVAFGEPLAPPASREEEEEFLDRLRERVAELTEQARGLYAEVGSST